MTKTLEYYKEFIEHNFQCHQFQIWIWRTFSDKPVLVLGDRELKEESPSFDEVTLYKEKQCVVAHSNYTDVQFSYAYGNRVIVRLFKQKTKIEERHVKALYYFMESLDLNETLKLRDREINNILYSTIAITSSLKLNDVLESIIKNIMHILPSIDAGHLMLYDPETERLVIQVQVGFNASVANFSTRVGESITGNVFKDGKARVYKIQEEMINAMLKSGISEENYRTILGAADFSYSGIICVPIEIHGTRIGVLTLHKWNPLAEVSDQTIRLIAGFTNQAGIAIQNAYLHEQMSERLTTISSLNRELQQSYDIQTQLTEISMENKGLEHIIRTVSKIINHSFVFYNATDQSFYSTPNNDIDYNWITPQDLQDQFEKNKEPISWTAQKTRQELYLYPIYSQSLFLGCFIIFNRSELSKSDTIALEQSSTVIALELVKTQALTNMYYRRAHEQFSALLEAGNTEDLMNKGEELNLPLDHFYRVAILDFSHEMIDLQQIDMAIYQLLLRIKQAFPNNKKIAYGQHKTIILLLSAPEKKTLETIYETLVSIQENNRYPFRGGISAIYRGLDNLNTCHEEAVKTLEYLERRNSPRLLLYEEIGLGRLFINQSPYEIDKFIDETFSVFSKENNYSYLEDTLLTYIDLNQAATKTAETLNIHINTVYQRLDKIQEVLDCDFDNSEDLLNIQLACYLKRTRKGLK